ncbi:hypothetical protein AAFF_G00047040 [Aldrovandia affinis]|uniref:BEN domain-containing protein n=1 Tax=Aldrovandia affinis TaxID=143900 RepID=A0AAD7S208_9TELE|nr:hypothetical protein AAFF_G00047040 [Aldrovandia affinis]
MIVTSEEEEDDDNSLLSQTPRQQQPEKVLLELDQETLKALKELPGLVATMKAVLSQSGSSICSSNQSDSSQRTGSDAGSDDLMFLVNSTVQVRKRLFQRISNKRMTLFTQDLATLVFGRDTLAKSTLTGKGKKGDTKDQLDPVKVLAIIDTVRDKFPNAEVSEIRALLRRKCNNEGYAKVPCHQPQPPC